MASASHETMLSLMPDEVQVANNEDLWQLIESCGDDGELELGHSLLDVWWNGLDQDGDGEKRQAKEKIRQLLMKWRKKYEHDEWYLLKIMKEFELSELREMEMEIQMKVLLREFDLSLEQISELTNTAKCDNLIQDERTLAMLRNLLMKTPKKAKLVIDLFQDKLNLNSIYVQCLIHALKNNYKSLLLDLLYVMPDQDINQTNLKLFEEICSKFSSDEDLMELYSAAFLRKTPKLIQTLSQIRRDTKKEQLFDIKSQTFNFKESFLLATHEKKHLMIELLQNDDHQVYLQMPSPFKLFFLLNYLHNKDLKLESFNQIEQVLHGLVFDCVQIKTLVKCDSFFKCLVKRLSFIFLMTNWCLKMSSKCESNHQSNLKFIIFQSLLQEETPLKVLYENGFLKNKKINNTINEELCELLSSYNECELMTYRAFLSIRLSIMWILDHESAQDNDFPSKISSLLKRLQPLAFKVEVMENIFSLLFVTPNELAENDIYKHSMSTFDSFLLKDSPLSSLTNSTVKNSANFLTPNDIVADFLSLLKEAVLDTQAKLFELKRNSVDVEYFEHELMNVACSMNGLAECKKRLNALMQFISEAQWRYSVIEPAFNRTTTRKNFKRQDNVLSTASSSEKDNDDSEESDVLVLKEENEHRTKLLNLVSIESEYEQQKESSTSLISCMLASPNQLLRYSLIEGEIDRAKQVVKLFETQIANSEEVIELQMIEKWSELSDEMQTFYSPHKGLGVSKRGEFSFEVDMKKIQTLIHEHLTSLKCDEKTKMTYLCDFALTSSPSLAISRAIFDQVLNNKNRLDFPEKVNSLLQNIHTMLKEVNDEHDLNSISLNMLFTHLYEDNLFCDIKAYKESKNNDSQLISAYEELKKQLDMLDPKKMSDTENPHSPQAMNPMLSPLADAKRINLLYEKLMRVCPTGKYNYLKSLFYYVRRVSKALNECRKRSKRKSKETSAQSFNSSCYFAILQQSPSAILCSMILKDGISPKFVDDLAKDMKVDLVGTLCSVLCAPIPAHYRDGFPNEFMLTDSCQPALCQLIESHLKMDKPSKSELSSLLVASYFEDQSDTEDKFVDEKINSTDLIEYFKAKSPLLIELMKLMKLIRENDEKSLSQEQFFKEGSPLLKWIDLIKQKFNSPGIDYTSLIALALHPRIYAGHCTVLKSLEYRAVKGDLLGIYEIFSFIDDKITFPLFYEESSSYKTLKASVLAKLATQQEDIKYALQLECQPTKCDVILELIDCSKVFRNADSAVKAIKACLASFNTDDDNLETCKKKLNKRMKEIEFYVKIGGLAGLRSWIDAEQSLSGIDILTIIKSKRKYMLAIEWFKIRDWESETSDLQAELLIIAYCEKNDLKALDELLNSFSEKHINSLTLIQKVMTHIDNLDCRQFLKESILEKHRAILSSPQIEHYNSYLKGIKIVKLLPFEVRQHYIQLIAKPMLIIEQMLMNIELESLEKAIKELNSPMIDNLLEKYAQKTVEIDVCDISGNSSNGGSVISDATLISSIIESNNHFVMPNSIPTKEQWIPDSKVIHCMICKIEKFGMLNRKHHCRRCGRVICSTCSQNTMVIKEVNNFASVRVCDDCYFQTLQKNRKDSTISSTSSPSSSQNKPAMWMINLDELQNESTRSEFYYESSPSVSLCLAILKLHSDKKRCCKVIVDLICKPLLEMVVSSQVDYGLMIGMIRSLLTSAKISLGDESSDMINSLDFLLGRLDVIRMLINANCNTKEYISYAFSSNENSILRLQEKLIEMERFELTRDLAMKFGFDLKSIWKTWAFICLKYGHFADAREKFKQCMQFNKNIENNKKILEEIIACLEKQRNSPFLPLRDQCSQIKLAKYSFYDSSNNQSFDESNFKISTKVLNEITYYLERYGSKEDMVKFYARHGVWKNAIEIVFNDGHSNLANTFAKEIFMTSAKSGTLKTLLNAISISDPTYNKSWKFLIATCKYLSKNNFFHVLHVLQVFMNDYLRAAITQINCFYLNPPASNYNELHQRIEHLQIAKQHCRTFLSIDESILHSGCLRMDKSEVMKQIRTLNLQIEISSQFSDRNIKGFLPFEESLDINSPEKEGIKSPPTLLSHSKARKTELSALVVISFGASISEGFTIAQQIIKDYTLDSSQVYRLAGRAIVQSEQLDIVDCVTQLVECIRISIKPEDEHSNLCDDVLTACIRSCKSNQLIEPLIRLLSSDINKIDAYILSGKLKLAYLLAIRLDRVGDVMRVLEAAKRSNQNQIKNICEQWIEKKGNKISS